MSAKASLGAGIYSYFTTPTTRAHIQYTGNIIKPNFNRKCNHDSGYLFKMKKERKKTPLMLTK
jgi:hypothetical protein